MSSNAYNNPEYIFQQQYQSVRRDEIVGVLLALFLGGFGAHHFYLRRTGMGVLYLLFSWTGVPWLIGFLECFFMPGRVREFNAIQAATIAAAVGMVPPIWSDPFAVPVFVPAPLVGCRRCQATNTADARFCSSCGSPLA
jgi:TM2 domain-containing membrane protein YozV